MNPTTVSAVQISSGDTGPVQAARQGDSAAYNRLMLKYQDAAFNLAWQILGDDNLAGSAVSSAMTQLWQGLNVEMGQPFRLALLRRTVEACRKLSSSARPQRPLIRGGWASLSDLLPASLRAPLYLVDGENLSYAEAAWVLGENVDRLRGRVATARVRAAAAL